MSNQESAAADMTLPPDLANKLVTIGRKHYVRRGQILLSEGVESTDVLYIIEGIVQITLFGEQGQETILRNLSTGHIFGEMSAIDGLPRSANVVAIEDGSLVFVSAIQFQTFLRDTPDAADFMTRMLIQRVRDLTRKLHELATLPMAHRLIAEIARGGCPCDDGESMIVDPFPTHVELAARIGSQREAVSREIGVLKRAGLIEKDGHAVRIPSLKLMLDRLTHSRKRGG